VRPARRPRRRTDGLSPRASEYLYLEPDGNLEGWTRVFSQYENFFTTKLYWYDLGKQRAVWRSASHSTKHTVLVLQQNSDLVLWTVTESARGVVSTYDSRIWYTNTTC
jgi:hypothetical protein